MAVKNMTKLVVFSALLIVWVHRFTFWGDHQIMALTVVQHTMVQHTVVQHTMVQHAVVHGVCLE
jgi:hypothetical protein